MTEERVEKNIMGVADTRALAQRLIEAGVLTGDKELIETGIARWKKVWPADVVDIQAKLYQEYLKEELRSKKKIQGSSI